MTPESVRTAYNQALPVVREVERYVQKTLRPMAKRNGYLFLDRVKNEESLAEKLDTGRFNSWSEVNDLYAATIVVPLVEHEDAVLAFLDGAFSRSEVRARWSTRKDPSTFRFDGLRWYGNVQPEVASEKQPGFGELVFEVQIVTAFEWAWGKVTHDLVYKGEHADWKRLRLAAHLKASVEQIELMIAAFDAASSQVRSSPWPETDAAEAVLKRFRMFVEEGLLDEVAAPRSWNRFADNVVSLVKSYQRSDLSAGVIELLDAIEFDLRGGSLTPVSVSYFQYVVSFVSRPDTPGHTRKHVVVPSSEFELLGIREGFTKQFAFPERADND
ncbi:hypothetical protein EQW78_01755 [Oerskovia turbata]|uniref:RelA/SpoT domain-containing protein n=1 Tax=Oerskovia turbata TaxID=1713 RepID=A0A4Q1L108_9CELL|nr:hypothetical protein [Oerskovia turbata]RXR27110.1 hypothetical protein EQW73_06665 [Oerskovia turbata]RXR36322.1 hypothetical protein EQW78_01755 [Oerskovia turbata]TGJ95512.1 hypothetical protein DLJ96_13285 [Actinotalea fermentans ATCC 43279 = JCM 9966 = DSM 3133]